jgi:hypothetical protein
VNDFEDLYGLPPLGNIALEIFGQLPGVKFGDLLRIL